MLLVYRHTLIVLYICLCIACFTGNIVWALLIFGASTSSAAAPVVVPAVPVVVPVPPAGVGVVPPALAVATTTTAAATNTSKSTEYIITIKNDVSLQLLKVVCIILNAIVIPLLIYFFYTYRKTWW